MTPTPKLFISYRRGETGAHAGRLHDAMTARFGQDNVFLDVDLRPGDDFVDRITSTVGACEALVVVIGPQWATAKGESGQPRLAEPDDFVRLEVETALQRPDVHLIPVLVAGARMPDAEELPASLRQLTRQQALPLTDLNWARDVEVLLDALFDIVRRARWSSPGAFGAVLLQGALVAAGAGGLAFALAGGIHSNPGDGETSRIVTTAMRNGVVWSLVGAALATWLAVRRRTGRQLAERGLAGLLAGLLAGVLGGATFATAKFSLELSPDGLPALAVVTLALTAVVLGALLGAQWVPRRAAAAAAAAAIGAAIAQSALNTLGWPADPTKAFDINAKGEGIAAVAVQGGAIALAALAVLVAAELRAAAATRRVPAPAGVQG